MKEKILDLYEEYSIMPNLQEHMLRVAAVASLICDNFEGEIDKEKILQACLLHDMGNIVKFKLEQFPEFLEPEGLDYWEDIQAEFKVKYDANEQKATKKILKRIGMDKSVMELVNAIDFIKAPEILASEDMNKKICYYADCRVTPYGITSLEERSKEGEERYKGIRKALTPEERAQKHKEHREIEKQIFARCKIKPEEINDESAKPVIAKLKKFVIK